MTGEPAEAAHTGGHGIGQRASDYRAIPLTPRLHRWEYAGSWHRLGRKAFEERYGIDVEQEIVRLNGAWAAQ